MIELIRPKIELFDSYMEFINEMHELGEKIWEDIIQKGEESPELFIERLLQAETTPIVDRVPETTYWGTIKNEVVGRISFRHKLNENLSEFGGHIGYEVRPSFRKKGVAKEMLKSLLATPRAKEIGRLLLTCSPDNIASNKTITANGGVLAETRFVKKWNRNTNYYWINLSN
jgi:predicted acetyltransferase